MYLFLGTTSCGNKVVSHSDILAGKAAGAVSWSIEKKVSTVPVGAQLYQRLTDYLMSSTELIQNGYPRKCPNTFKGKSSILVEIPPFSVLNVRLRCNLCKNLVHRLFGTSRDKAPGRLYIQSSYRRI